VRMNPPVLDGTRHDRRHGMRIYLAARYSRHEEMQGVRDVLQALGHTVTSRWIEAPEGRYGRGSFTREQLDEDPEYCRAVAERDIADIEAADTFIAFTEADGGGKGGRHAELGYVLALARYRHEPMRVIVVGLREHVFHTTGGIRWYPDWPRLVMALTRESRQAAGPVTEEAEWFAREGGTH